jgi:hypothetical protein
MRARKLNLWMIVSVLALALIASYGYSTKKVTDSTTDKEVCKASDKEDCKTSVRETSLKRASLQLWENIARL